MKIKCDLCGGQTTIKSSQRHQYEECGLDNIILVNIQMRVCKSCGAKAPIIPRILGLHATIGRAVALQAYPLSGLEVRFLRKQLGMSAREWAVLLRIDHTTLSRWENDEQRIGPQSDALIRFLYFRMVEEKEGKLIPDHISERIAAPSQKRKKHASVLVNMNNPTVYSYQCA